MVLRASDEKSGGVERRRLVLKAAEKLREIILSRPPGAHIGSLQAVSKLLEVGIVTVQQAARILEHEGLLAVRRGPGGGYYGARPDDAALERSLASYLRVHGAARAEARTITTLLDCELIAAAARCPDEALRQELRAQREVISACDAAHERIAWEQRFRALLFRMDARPLLELICRVTVQLYNEHELPPLYAGAEGVEAWKRENQRIVDAILSRDAELARFEAERRRQSLLARFEQLTAQIRGDG